MFTSSCIHPSRLDLHKIKHPEIYEKCFHDQCKTSKCDSAPQGSYCSMKNRHCANIQDWCSPTWHPNRSNQVFNQWTYAVDNYRERRVMRTQYQKVASFQIDCTDKTGRVCCQFLMDAGVKMKDINKFNNATLPIICALIWSEEMMNIFKEFVKQLPNGMDISSFENEFASDIPVMLWDQYSLGIIDNIINTDEDRLELRVNGHAKNVKTPEGWKKYVKNLLMSEYIENNLCVDVLLFSEQI